MGELDDHKPKQEEPLLAELVAALFCGPVLCAHAVSNGKGMHWMEAGDTCDLSSKNRGLKQ